MLPQWFKKQFFKIKKQAVILMRNESTHFYVTTNVSTFIACATRGRCSGASFHLNLQCIKQRLLSNLLYRRAVMGGGGHYPGITRQRREQRHECCTHESLRSGPARWRRRRAAETELTAWPTDLETAEWRSGPRPSHCCTDPETNPTCCFTLCCC